MQELRSIRIKKRICFRVYLSDLLMFFSIFPIIVTDCVITLTPITSQILYYFELLDFVMLLALIIKSNGKKSYPITKLLYVIYATVLLSGMFHGELKLTFYQLLIGLLMCMASDYWLRVRADRFICLMKFVLSAMVIINFVSIIIFPDGMYTTEHYTNNWFLGYKNSHLQYMIAAIVFRSFSSFRKKGKLRGSDIVFMGIACYSSYLTDAMASFVAILAYMLLVMRYGTKHRFRVVDIIYSKINYSTLLLFSVALNLLCIFAGTTFLDNNLLLLMLGRNSDFTGRVRIWSVAIDMISKSPFIGYGVINSDVWITATGIFNGTHAHNYFLNILVMGGVICLIEHLVLYFKIWRLTVRNIECYSVGLLLGIYFVLGLTNINFFGSLFNVMFIYFNYSATTSSKYNISKI